MCEIAPGVYTSPRMTEGVRRRVWQVLQDWYQPSPDHAILMTWYAPDSPGGQEIKALGIPIHDLWNHDGVFLARRETSEEVIAEVKNDLDQSLGQGSDSEK